jgi:hypothetical protein
VSWLGLLNFIVLQWFGVRLARQSATVTTYSEPPWEVGAVVSVSAGYGTWRVAGISGTELELRRYLWLRWVWPLTGWWSDYRWIAKRP